MSGEINRRLKELSKDLDEKKMATLAYNKFKNTTPIAQERGGNARRNTRLVGSEIQANYPYAGVLDQGRGIRDGQMRGSTQAPRGMTTPTIEYLQKYIKDTGKG